MSLKALLAAGILGFAATASEATELLMVEEVGCVWCARWNADIAPIYPKSPEGQFAPLRRVDKGALPSDLILTSRPVYTPTFVLIDDGREIGRIEGYPGEDFFWGLLEQMLLERTSYVRPSS